MSQVFGAVAFLQSRIFPARAVDNWAMKNKHITLVTTKLPANVRSFMWVRNHHYVQLEDEEGNTVKLHAGGLLRGVCTQCNEVNFASSNQGAMVCTHCLSPVQWQWTKPQIAFVPEHEAKFLGFDTPQIGKPPLSIMQRAWLVMYTAITKRAPKASSAPKEEALVADDDKTPVGKPPTA
jgi:hypothetical protein